MCAPVLGAVGIVEEQREEGSRGEGGGRTCQKSERSCWSPRPLDSQEVMASDYFVLFVLSEGSHPTHGAVLGPVASETRSRERLEGDFSMDFGRHMVGGSRGQVLLASSAVGVKAGL